MKSPAPPALEDTLSGRRVDAPEQVMVEFIVDGR